jgi:serine/threonine protein kinase
MVVGSRFTFQDIPHGSGGFAKIIKGRDNDLERDVAVKVLDPLATAFSEADQERFRREARILARLSHPNIPAIYDIDFSPGKFSLISQFVDGVNLRQLLGKEGPCQVSEARLWFHQLASALEHAHSLEIIHRDVKPENIIITPDRESAYLVDFGIALSADEAKKLTKSGFVVGTPGYMSPEQQSGEELDKRTDVYSLAVTLYEALAGKSISIGDYGELSVANEAIPPQIDDLIRDCLLPRERRVESAKAFTVRLSGALRATKPLSEILAHGKLHELATALEDLSAEDFSKLPEGQRVLILAKVTDVVGSGDPKLQFASEQFLNLLLSRGLLLDKENYREIVRPSLQWAFEKSFGGDFIRSRSIQRSLDQAAYISRGGSHEVLREEFVEFLKGIELEKRENWYLQGIRDLLETLLANPSCTGGATELANVLKKINRIQRGRPRTPTRVGYVTGADTASATSD